MKTIVTILVLFMMASTGFAASDALNGRSFCRPVISSGEFGQPKGPKEICLDFSEGIVHDFNYTLGGNGPLSFPYQVEGRKLTFNRAEYEVSRDGQTLMAISGDNYGIVYLLKAASFNEIRMPSAWSYGRRNKSIAQTPQILHLYKLVMQETQSQRSNQESLAIINANLRAMGLPEIGEQPKIEIVESNGGFAGGIQGATFEDEKHRYCFPCSTGRGMYEIGIIALEKNQ